MSLLVLDTDILSLLQRGHPRVVSRCAARRPEELAISVISLEEQLSGWYSLLRKTKQPDELLTLPQLKHVGFSVRRGLLSESVPKALCYGPSPWSLVPKPIPVLRPGQPTEHQLNHADPDLRLAGISQVFIILAVNPAPTQPAEGSLHHPPPRQQLKPSVPGKPADDLNHIPPVLRDPSVQGVIVVLGVRPQLPQARERFARQLAEDLRCRRRIIHGRTGHGHS